MMQEREVCFVGRINQKLVQQPGIKLDRDLADISLDTSAASIVAKEQAHSVHAL